MSTRVVKVDGCDPIRLTHSMARGLLVAHSHDGRARRSNVTSDHRGLVYWQAADQLAAAGLIDIDAGRNHHSRLRTTPLGTRVVYTLGDAR
jgi:hypothetical protein